MDVKSLYTVIPHAEGLKALKHFLDLRSNQSPPTHTLVCLAELVLTLNHFQFDNEFFTQTNGVSIGTKMRPSYACLFLGYIENQFFAQYRGPQPETFLRYIDDCVGTTIMPRHDLESYIEAFEDAHPTIEFTFDI